MITNTKISNCPYVFKIVRFGSKICIVSIKYLSKRSIICKVSKGAKIRKRYNQVPHLTQDTNGKVLNSQLNTTNESQEVSPFPAGDHRAHINRRSQRHSKHKTEQHKRSTKEVPPWNGQLNILHEGLNQFHLPFLLPPLCYVVILCGV